MKTIQVAKLNIGMELFQMDEFTSLDKYQVEATPSYFIISKEFDSSLIPTHEPSYKTEFFTMYKQENIQVQYMNDRVVGMIQYERNTIYIYPIRHDFALEYLLSQYAFSYILALNDAIIMHGSSFIYNNKGIILTAKSGTGKSTHSRLWQRYENVCVINDDKNILMLEDDEKIHMYGAPWSGKHMLDNNVSSTLDAICFLYQNKTNEIRNLGVKEALIKVMGQIIPPSKSNREIWDKITNKLLSLPIYYLGCTMEKEAYLTLKERLDLDYANK